MSRRTLSDAQWAIIEPLVPGKKGDRGRTGADNRLFVDAILWLARGATPWRDLPPELGNWRTVHSRFRRWTLAGVWENLFKALRKDPDFEYVLVDATICKAHADATFSKRGLEAAGIGRSRGGLTTKVHAAVDALGLPVRFTITPGQWGDCPQAQGLIDGLSDVGHVIMDAAYDADYLRDFIANDLGAVAHIKRNPTRREDRPIDWVLYKERHLVECFFNRIKRFRRIALRCEKTISSFKAFVDLACAMAWLA
ncbi:IS5 family transposase [Paracoccus saliphilus]|uniref:IS5 family transposase n=1 Tax=Paracoccus saliphilus TaxID=405559 RepID=A0ABY7S2T4_9RHOB|nr:IS5 family transposase [Paracoccus saliphilus]WCR01385.1 IS5 family transposase [Paracoccus saliphilus]